jgi:hypothetical protein
MSIRIVFPLILLAAAANFPAAAQFGIPFPGQGGQYPGGGGVGFPGSGRRNTSNQPSDTLSGRIRRISLSQIALDPGDGRDVMVTLDRNTRYFDVGRRQARYGDFDAGDEVQIDASRDYNGYYIAVRVLMLRKGAPGDNNNTSDDQASSNKPKLKRAPGADGDSAPAERPASRGSSDDDPDRPRLKRAPADSDGDAAPAPRQVSSSRSSASDDPDRPVMRRASADDSPAAQERPRSQITNPDDDGSVTVARRRAVNPSSDGPIVPVARNADDPGPPVLRRGRPAPSRDSDTVARVDPAPASMPASARPSIRAEESNGVTKLPAPIVVAPAERPATVREDDEPAFGRAQATQGPGNGDPVIRSAREAAWAFTESLPNYVVKQYTTRYATETTRGNRTTWQAQDIVTADVVSEGGKESYKNIRVNGKVPKDSVENSGSWSTGEFQTIQLNLLSPGTDADFHNKRSTTIVNRAAFKYDYTVEKRNSNWDVHVSSESYKPGYSGTIWIDKENFRVLRIEMAAQNMPKSFALDQVETALDYDYVMIGDTKFLLPAHSETLSCIRNTSDCSRNVIEFRNYRKFGADTSITFETDK